MSEHSQGLDPERVYKAIEEGVYRAVWDCLPSSEGIAQAIRSGVYDAIDISTVGIQDAIARGMAEARQG